MTLIARLLATVLACGLTSCASDDGHRGEAQSDAPDIAPGPGPTGKNERSSGPTCDSAEDCIQVGNCDLAPPSCEHNELYMQIHCGEEPTFKVPGYSCACEAGKCVVGTVNQAGPGEVDYPPPYRP